MTHGADVDHRVVGISAYYATVGTMLDHGMSLVTDGTMYRGISETDIKNYLVKRAFVINLHTRAKNEKARFKKRESERTFYPNDWVEGHMRRLDEIYQDTLDPLDYGIECIEVDANDGYTPDITALAQDIMSRYDKNRQKKEGKLELL